MTQIVLFGQSKPVAMFLVVALHLRVADHDIAANMLIGHSHEYELIAHGLEVAGARRVEDVPCRAICSMACLTSMSDTSTFFALASWSCNFRSISFVKAMYSAVFSRWGDQFHGVYGRDALARLKLALNIGEHDQLGIDDGDDTILQVS